MRTCCCGRERPEAETRGGGAGSPGGHKEIPEGSRGVETVWRVSERVWGAVRRKRDGRAHGHGEPRAGRLAIVERNRGYDMTLNGYINDPCVVCLGISVLSSCIICAFSICETERSRLAPSRLPFPTGRRLHRAYLTPKLRIHRRADPVSSLVPLGHDAPIHGGPTCA